MLNPPDSIAFLLVVQRRSAIQKQAYGLVRVRPHDAGIPYNQSS